MGKDKFPLIYPLPRYYSVRGTAVSVSWSSPPEKAETSSRGRIQVALEAADEAIRKASASSLAAVKGQGSAGGT
jgi:hypothetical protein